MGGSSSTTTGRLNNLTTMRDRGHPMSSFSYARIGNVSQHSRGPVHHIDPYRLPAGKIASLIDFDVPNSAKVCWNNIFKLYHYPFQKILESLQCMHADYIRNVHAC